MANNYLTQNDVDNYGRDLLDVAQRAAMQTVAPHLQNLEYQNAQLRQHLAKEARHRLDQQVEAAVPNFREIDRDPRWHRWLLGIDPLTGRPRQVLLNDAVARGNPTRVREFFERFQREAGGTQTYSAVSNRRARRSDRPIYTRDQISKLYRAHQQGAYTGREAEWARLEHEIIAAGREGRILGAVDVQGK
jgi:hypothetical protein